MKFLIIGITILVVIFLFLAITLQIFGNTATNGIFSSTTLVDSPGSVGTSGTGQPVASGTSATANNSGAQSGFHGPGPPHIIGPSGQPPDY